MVRMVCLLAPWLRVGVSEADVAVAEVKVSRVSRMRKGWCRLARFGVQVDGCTRVKETRLFSSALRVSLSGDGGGGLIQVTIRSASQV